MSKELSERDAHFSMHGVQAQNYHIMTPAVGKDWALAWGCNSYVRNLPYANAAHSYNFKPGESGKLVLELRITPFDYVGCEGPQKTVESVLTEDKLIGMAAPAHHVWQGGRTGRVSAYAAGTFAAEFEAKWSFDVFDMAHRAVAFRDKSTRKIDARKWTFEDRESSTEANPVHRYAKGGDYTVTLEVRGPEGVSRMERIWDVSVR
jgi:hypothetical protein